MRGIFIVLYIEYRSMLQVTFLGNAIVALSSSNGNLEYMFCQLRKFIHI